VLLLMVLTLDDPSEEYLRTIRYVNVREQIDMADTESVRIWPSQKEGELGKQARKLLFSTVDGVKVPATEGAKEIVQKVRLRPTGELEIDPVNDDSPTDTQLTQIFWATRLAQPTAEIWEKAATVRFSVPNKNLARFRYLTADLKIAGTVKTDAFGVEAIDFLASSVRLPGGSIVCEVRAQQIRKVD
jgi:hypothetical protein